MDPNRLGLDGSYLATAGYLGDSWWCASGGSWAEPWFGRPSSSKYDTTLHDGLHGTHTARTCTVTPPTRIARRRVGKRLNVDNSDLEVSAIRVDGSCVDRDGCAETGRSRADALPTTGTDESKLLDEKSLICKSPEIAGECHCFLPNRPLKTEQADGPTVLDIQGGGDSLSRSNEDGPSEEIKKSERRTDDLDHSHSLPSLHDEKGFLSGEVVPSFLHGVSSSNSSTFSSGRCVVFNSSREFKRVVMGRKI